MAIAFVDDISQSSEPEHYLAHQFRQLVQQIVQDDEEFHAKMSEYVKYASPKDDYLGIAFKANLYKSLLAPEMTWKVFLKGLSVLGVMELDTVFVPRLHQGLKARTEGTLQVL